jgi:DNA-3-methyladenine glycosylase
MNFLLKSGRKLKHGDFLAPSHEVARALIGTVLVVDGVGGRIVETEAYDRLDPASHSFAGPTARNQAMFGPPGRAYVYRSYGIHWCLNFVCREEGHGAGVLIRALEPLLGLDVMRKRRGVEDVRLLCSGPGRVGEALGITLDLNGKRLDQFPFQLVSSTEPVPVVKGPRIGISKARQVHWRFGLQGLRRPQKRQHEPPLLSVSECIELGQRRQRDFLHSSRS